MRSRDSETTLRAAPICAVVFEARAPAQLAPEVRPEALEQAAARGRRRRRRACVRPSSARRAAVFGPMPGTRPGGAEAKRAHACSRVSTTNPAGFSASEATFATSLFGPMPTEQVSCIVALDLGDQPAHRRARREQAVEVQVGLVEAHHLDALHVRAHDRHHLRRDLAVGGEVGREEHRLRAQPPRPRGGHRRADAVAARLVAGGRDDRARSAAGDDHRPAAQLGVAPQLDRDVERVGVEVRGAQLGRLDGHVLESSAGSGGSASSFKPVTGSEASIDFVHGNYAQTYTASAWNIRAARRGCGAPPRGHRQRRRAHPASPPTPHWCRYRERARDAERMKRLRARKPGTGAVKLIRQGRAELERRAS